MDKEISWQTLDHVHTPKEADWFWVLGIIAVSGIIISILFHNFFFALLIFAASITLTLLAKRNAKTIQFKINGSGLTVGSDFYPWTTIKTFWIFIKETNTPILLINTLKLLTPHLSIPLPPNRVNEIHIFLREYLTEEELNEPTSHKITDFFGI